MTRVSLSRIYSVYGPQLADLQVSSEHVWLMVHTSAPLPPGHSSAAPDWLRNELRERTKEFIDQQ